MLNDVLKRVIHTSDGTILSVFASTVCTALSTGKSAAVQCVKLEGNRAENVVLVGEKFEKTDPDGHCFVYHPSHEERIGI
jgi:hypothetical protein